MYHRVNKGSDLQLYFPTKGVTAENILSCNFKFYTDKAYFIDMEYESEYCKIEDGKYSIYLSSTELDKLNEGVLRYEYTVSYESDKPEIVDYVEKSNTEYYIKRSGVVPPVPPTPGGDYYTKEEIDDKFSHIEKPEAKDVYMNYTSDIFDFDNVYDGIDQIASTTEELDKLKADKNYFKTVNGESIIGTGDIEISGGKRQFILSPGQDDPDVIAELWKYLMVDRKPFEDIEIYISNTNTPTYALPYSQKVVACLIDTNTGFPNLTFTVMDAGESRTYIYDYRGHIGGNTQKWVTNTSGNMSYIWVGTKSEYDAITPKLNNTVYLIKE